MANLDDGTYRILLASNPGFSLDVAGASRGNGANVRLMPRDPDSDGQVFEVSTSADGTCRIVSRFSGKSLDCSGGEPKLADGVNVQQWTSNTGRGQRWDVADTGSTATVDGAALPAYTVSVDGKDSVVEADGDGTVTLAGAIPGKRLESIGFYGAFASGAAMTGAITVGSASVELPTYLAALPSGTADRAVIDATGMAVMRNVGMMTEFDPEDPEQVELAGDDWASSTGALDAGATVYYAIPDEAAEDGEPEADDASEDVQEDGEAVSRVESYPTVALPEVAAAGDPVALPMAAPLTVAYWAHEPADATLHMAAASASAKANVAARAASSTTYALRRWVFAPVPEFESGGCYELHSYESTREVLSSTGTTKGANVHVMADKDSNLQRWVMSEASPGHWTLQNVGSRMYLAVAANKMANGTNVIQHDTPTSQSQQWHVTSYGTVAHGGRQCPLVKLTAWGSHPDNPSATHYNLDVAGASKTVRDKSNVCIYQDDDSADQRWVLVRTTAVDGSIGVPDSLSAAWSPGGSSSAAMGVYGGTHRFYPCWQAPDNWLATNSANNYQLRRRERYMDSDTGRWGAWSAYSPWRTAPCKIIDRYSDAKRRGKGGWAGEQAWATDPVRVSLPLQDHEDADGLVVQGVKAAEVQFGVRCVGAGAKANVVGRDAYRVIRLSYAPDMALAEAVWSPEGYRLRFESDYDKGQWSVQLQELAVNGVKVVSKPVTFNGLAGTSGTALVKLDGTKGTIYNLGSNVTAKWKVTTDLGTFGKTYTGSVPLTRDSGHGAQARPSVSHGACWVDTATIDHPRGAKARLWTRWYTADGWRFAEVAGKSSGTRTAFAYCPPQSAYQLWATVQAGNDTWATSYSWVADRPVAKRHVWTDGTRPAAQLMVRRGEALSLDGSVSADSDVARLDSRPWGSVRFGPTKSQRLTVEGTAWVMEIGANTQPVWGHDPAHSMHMPIAAGEGYVDIQNVKALAGRHLTYRSPWGDVLKVAVTDVKYEKRGHMADVAVTMVVEEVL